VALDAPPDGRLHSGRCTLPGHSSHIALGALGRASSPWSRRHRESCAPPGQRRPCCTPVPAWQRTRRRPETSASAADVTAPPDLPVAPRFAVRGLRETGTLRLRPLLAGCAVGGITPTPDGQSCGGNAPRK